MFKCFLSVFTICFSTVVFSQEIEIVTAQQLKEKYTHDNDTSYVINFWATWCKPCIEELPFFLQLENELTNEKVKFIFVSLDDSKYKSNRVLPFVSKHKMKNVFIIEDNDPNEWIPLINDEWTGSIPATLIIKNNHQTFLEQKLDYVSLKQQVEKIKGAQ